MGRYILLALVIYALVLSFVLYRKPLRSRKTTPPTPLGEKLRLLLIGATGGTGQKILEQALARGHEVTALVRTPGKMEITHPNLRVVKGDVLDYSSVEAAMQGQDAVLCALGHKKFFGPSSVLSEGTRNILRAMQTCGVPRLIVESSLGVGNAVGRLGILTTIFAVPVILPFYFYDRVRQEKLIEESDRDWVIVRPSALTNGPARGEYKHGEVGSYILPTRVSRADVAEFMLRQLHDDRYLGAAPGLCY